MMSNHKSKFKTEKELQKAILEEKSRGTPDIELGQKYGVTFRYIEKLITRTKGLNISNLNKSKKVKSFYPKDFYEEQTTVWSFKQRGSWATHSGEYRGNWSPYIPRNVILKYSKPTELVLDYFCGAGTTAVECKLLGRKCIAFDINAKAIELAKKNLVFDISASINSTCKKVKDAPYQIYEPELLVGDARDLFFIEDNSIDLICSHPPYSNIIHYTDSKSGDLSFFDIDDFLIEISKVAKESFRVLKPGRQCVILIGDTRRKKHVIPLGFKFISVFLKAGFKLRELIIKRQHNCKTTGFWHKNSIKYNFLLLAHEYLPVFEKPEIAYPLEVKESVAEYNLVSPILENPVIKKKLDTLETTTVWVLPDKDFEERLNKNIIDRYSNKRGYLIINLVSNAQDKKGFNEKLIQNGNNLLYIKSSFLKNNLTHSNLEFYLNKVKEIIEQNLTNMDKDGFVIIQTQDIRVDDYLEPLSKRIIDMVNFNNLWLKEIIVVTNENSNSLKGSHGSSQNSENYLNITHQYLIVYKVTMR